MVEFGICEGKQNYTNLNILVPGRIQLYLLAVGKKGSGRRQQAGRKIIDLYQGSVTFVFCICSTSL
jgi:hypothetical protein